jgi:hypothetical protein
MKLDPVEVGRLAIMQSEPLRYIERRVEDVELIDDSRYAVTTRLQFTVPYHQQKAEEKHRSSKTLLVPLGWYAKDRMPDIRVRAEDDTDLPLLRRRDQGKVVATIFGIRWRQKFVSNLSETPDGPEAQTIWGIIHTSLEQIVTAQRLGAQIVIYRLRRFIWERSKDTTLSKGVKCFLLDILTANEFWRSLKKLGENRLLIARMRGKPDRTYVVTTTNTERFGYGPSLLTMLKRLVRRGRDRQDESIRRQLSNIVGKTFAWLGVSRVSIVRDVANLGQAASFWIIFSSPEGVEPIRCFWRSRRNEVRYEDVISVGNGKVAAGQHHEQGKTVASDKLALDVQIDASQSIASAAGLAGLLYFVGLFVYKAMPQLVHEQLTHKQHSDFTARLLGVGTILAAAPAAIAGALAYRGHPFVRRMSRGPRVILSLLSAQGALLAVVAGLHGPGELAEVLALILSVSGLSAVGLFFWIRCGPRWRKTERSRRELITQAASPNQCRQRQARYAFAWLLFWLLVVLVAVHTQDVFQREHIFRGHSFPADVWNTWWAWFGL